MPGLTLAAISILAAAGMLWVIRRTSDQAAIRRAKKLLRAGIYELRMFGDEPELIWRAQRRLLEGSFRFLGLMLRPMLVLVLPLTLLLIGLECLYGRRPLAIGESTIVTVRTKQPLELNARPPSLEAPAGIVIETPPVRVPARREFSWRIRAVAGVSGKLRVRGLDSACERRVESGAGMRFLGMRRPGWLPSDGPFEWMDIRYPPAEVRIFGLAFHWMVWFIGFSWTAAWMMAGWFRVTF
jgi:hypothetical protein